jgi:hypothetical protein
MCDRREEKRREEEIATSLSLSLSLSLLLLLLLLLDFFFVSRLLPLQATELASERPACTLASRFS